MYVVMQKYGKLSLNYLLPLFIWSTELTQVEKGGSTEISVLQIRRANRDNLGIIRHISQ